MTVPELFSLRWNDFHSNLTQGFHSFLESEDMVDVTLSAGGQFMRAHKLILSLSSPYFRALFTLHKQGNLCTHPIVILKDVLPDNLKLILKFIYTGEVTIHRNNLSNFLHTAEALQIKGLTAATGKEGTCESQVLIDDIAQNAHKKEKKEENASEDPLKIDEEAKNKLNDTIPTINCHETLQELKFESPEHPKRVKKEWNTTDSESSSGSEQFDHVAENDHEWQGKYSSDSFEQRMDIEDYTSEGIDRSKKMANGWKPKMGGVKCTSCNRIFANRYNLKVHVRDKHVVSDKKLECHICKKTMRNPSCLRVHLYHHRKQALQDPNNHRVTPSGVNDDSDNSLDPNGLPEPIHL